MYFIFQNDCSELDNQSIAVDVCGGSRSGRRAGQRSGANAAHGMARLAAAQVYHRLRTIPGRVRQVSDGR